MDQDQTAPTAADYSGSTLFYKEASTQFRQAQFFLNFFEVRNQARGLPDSSPSGVSTEAQTTTIFAPESHYTRLELRSHKL